MKLSEAEMSLFQEALTHPELIIFLSSMGVVALALLVTWEAVKNKKEK